MIRIGLVDDDRDHIQHMKSFLLRYEKEEKIQFEIKEYTDGLNFAEDYAGSLDVVFLDIEMPHMGLHRLTGDRIDLRRGVCTTVYIGSTSLRRSKHGSC